MLKAYRGRIDRKTFIAGCSLGLIVLGFAALIYIVPIAIIDILMTSVADVKAARSVFQVLYSLFLIPAALYLFFFSVLFVRRIHDIGYPGMLILWTLVISAVLAQLLDNFYLNFVWLTLVFVAAFWPGQKTRNTFGQKPRRKLDLKELAMRL